MWPSVEELLRAGGPVLWLIMMCAAVLWFYILERYIFLWWQYPRESRAVVDHWRARAMGSDWYARKIRAAAISRMQHRLDGSRHLIRSLIVLCPLLGILGTVTGMIAVFDVITYFGGGNARAMASGIALATLPTMAGMVVALSGVYFELDIRQRIRVAIENLATGLSVADKGYES